MRLPAAKALLVAALSIALPVSSEGARTTSNLFRGPRRQIDFGDSLLTRLQDFSYEPFIYRTAFVDPTQALTNPPGLESQVSKDAIDALENAPWKKVAAEGMRFLFKFASREPHVMVLSPQQDGKSYISASLSLQFFPDPRGWIRSNVRLSTFGFGRGFGGSTSARSLEIVNDHDRLFSWGLEGMLMNMHQRGGQGMAESPETLAQEMARNPPFPDFESSLDLMLPERTKSEEFQEPSDAAKGQVMESKVAAAAARRAGAFADDAGEPALKRVKVEASSSVRPDTPPQSMAEHSWADVSGRLSPIQWPKSPKADAEAEAEGAAEREAHSSAMDSGAASAAAGGAASGGLYAGDVRDDFIDKLLSGEIDGLGDPLDGFLDEYVDSATFAQAVLEAHDDRAKETAVLTAAKKAKVLKPMAMKAIESGTVLAEVSGHGSEEPGAALVQELEGAGAEVEVEYPDATSSRPREMARMRASASQMVSIKCKHQPMMEMTMRPSYFFCLAGPTVRWYGMLGDGQLMEVVLVPKPL